MREKYWYLKHCDLFGHLSDEEMRGMESRSRMRKIPRNSPIYLPIDQADGVLLLADGQVKICSVTPDGKQSILAFVEPGELFGELAMFEAGSREEFAEATMSSTVILIPAHILRDIAEGNPRLAMGVTRLLGLRRRRIERRLKYLLFRSNRERLIHLLLELAEDYGRVDSHSPTGEVRLGIKLSHQDLASIIGSTRETVTVILGQLQHEGFLRLGRRKISMRHLDRLAESVNAQPPRLATPATSAEPRLNSPLGPVIFQTVTVSSKL